MDPSPFPEKDLDQDAEEFIVSWAQEFPKKDPVSLLVRVNELPRHGDAQQLVETAMHNYFAYRAKLKRLELRHLLKQGRTTLVIGLVFLGVCLTASELVRRLSLAAISTVLGESFTIAGWVAMWRPMQIFLYEWWPIRRMERLFEKMSLMHVEIRARAAQGSS
jgi:hypothetical protein